MCKYLEHRFSCYSTFDPDPAALGFPSQVPLVEIAKRRIRHVVQVALHSGLEHSLCIKRDIREKPVMDRSNKNRLQTRDVKKAWFR